MKEKVLFLIHSLRHGGAERITLELSKYLNDRKLNSKIVSWVKNSQFTNYYKYKNLKILYILKKKKYHLLNDFIESVKRINLIVRKEKPSLIHVNSTNTLLLLMFLNFKNPIIFLTHGYVFLESKFLSKLFIFKIFNIILFRFKKMKIVSVSQKMIPIISKFFLIPKKKVLYINNGTNINYFKRKKIDSKKIKNLIIVGTLSYHKGQLIGLELFKKLLKISNDYQLYILGSGPDEKRIRNFIIENSLDDKIKLILSTNKLKKYLQKSHLMWTLSQSEGMPLSIMEAMSMGIPCIGYDVRGVNEVIINNVNGFLVDYGYNKKILEKTIELLADKKKYKNFSKHASSHIKKNFNIENCLFKHYSLIQNIHGMERCNK